MFTYYWKLAVVMALIVPLYGLIYWAVNRVNRTYQRQLMENAAELESQLVESLNAVSTIKRFGLEQFANEKTETRFISLLQTIYRSGSNSIWAGTASEFISRLFTIILLWLGASFVLDKQITPGELLSFYALVGYFTGPASSLIGANRSIQDARIAADLSTVRNADKIIVLEQGRVIEEGNHADLLKNGQTYQQFWQQQSEVIE